MNISAMAIGNHEFDWGIDVLKARIRQADFTFVAANIYRKNRCRERRICQYIDCFFCDRIPPLHPAWARPFIIERVNGYKVAVIVLATPDTSSVTNPIHVEHLEFTDPVVAVNKIMPRVMWRNPDLVVVLAHIGGYWPEFAEGIMDLNCGLDPEQVDLIVSGHTHSRIDDVMCDIPVVQSYSINTRRPSTYMI